MGSLTRRYFLLSATVVSAAYAGRGAREFRILSRRCRHGCSGKQLSLGAAELGAASSRARARRPPLPRRRPGEQFAPRAIGC